MELFYCDACGLRIKSGDGQLGADELRYCETCFAKKFPGSAPPSASVRTTTPSPGTFKSGAVIASPNDSSSRRKPSKQEPVRSGNTGTSTTLIAAGGGGAAALLLIGFLVWGGKSEAPTVAMKESPRALKDVKSEPNLVAAGSDGSTRVDKADKTEKSSPAFKAPASAFNQAPPAPPVDSNAPRNRAVPQETPQRGQTATPESKPESGRAGGGLFAPEALRANTQEDYRENYARRRLTELMEVEQKGTMKPAEFRKRVKELASGYSNTGAGQEAAEKLKALDSSVAAPVAASAGPGATDKQKTGAVEPEHVSPTEQARTLLGAAAPVEGTQILYKNSFDTDEEWKLAGGIKETAQTKSGTGVAVKSEPVSPGYFVARINLKFGQAPLKLGANSWMKLSYRTQGTADICFHSAVGGAVYEKFFFGIKPGKWQTLVLHFNQFGKCITRGNDSQPAPNSELQGITMFLGNGTGAGASAIIDDVVIGEGAVPQD